MATVTIYSEASAADSVRQADDPPLPEVGEDAFVSPFASVWAYAGDGSFFTQWYDFAATDEENLPEEHGARPARHRTSSETEPQDGDLSGPDGRMGPVTTGTSAPTYRLVRPATTAVVPDLDDEQRRVVEHAGGPLLVLAGPGTGKTTTLVEAIVRRIDEGAHPDSVLALTFSRKAAEQLRDRVAARVGRTMSASIGSTFHSFAYGLIRAHAPAELYEGPLRLLSAHPSRTWCSRSC